MAVNEETFIDWLSGAIFYIGNLRYGQFNGHHLVASSYYGDGQLKELVDDLDSGDNEALNASFKIGNMSENGSIYIGYHNSPVTAMANCVQKMRDFYFNELNRPGGEYSRR